MNTRYTERVDGKCWCNNPHPPYTDQHRVDTSDPNWPLQQATCMCGGGAWGVAHHA